jgi:hypothetical protein
LKIVDFWFLNSTINHLPVPSLQLAAERSPRNHRGMLPLQTRIVRTQRLLRMLEQDAPLLALRVAQLSPEHQKSAKSYAAKLTAQTRAELEKLLEHRTYWNSADAVPHPAD